jgi:hypothetical protein
MARIPTYDSQVAPNALPAVGQNISNSADQFLDGNAKGLDVLGKGLVAAGDAASFILADQTKMENEARVKEADVLYADKLRAMLYDPEKGYLNQMGKNALDSREALNKGLEALNSSSMEGMTNDVQRRLFSAVQNQRRQSALLQADTHESQQRKTYAVAQADTRAKAQIGEMVLHSASHGVTNADGKPIGAYNNAKATMAAEVDAQAKLLGWSEDQIKAKNLELLTVAHTQIIQDMVSKKNTKGATEYFKKYGERGEINEAQKAELTKYLETANVQSSGLDLQFQLTKDHKTEKAQLTALDQQYRDGQITSEVRDNAKTRIEHDWAKVRQAKNEGDKAMMGSAQEWVMKNPGKSVLEMPPNLYNWSKNNGHLAGLDGFAQREGRPAERMKEIKVRGELIRMASGSDEERKAFIDEFKRSGFSDRMDLGVTGIKEMQNIAGDMIGNNGKYKSDFDPKIMINLMPKALRESKNKDAQDAFTALQHEAQVRWQKANPGKQPTPEEQRKVGNEANADWVRMNPIMPNQTMPAYKIQGQTDIKAVPKEYYDWARKEAVARGVKITDDQILSGYQRQQAAKK